MDTLRIAVKLSEKPLCQWMQEDFSHIRDIDPSVSMLLLQEHDRIVHLISNPEWPQLKEALSFSDDFVRKNRERIKQFIYDDGAYIMWNYYKGTASKKEELRRLVSAEGSRS